ncbi:hypothetical protein VCHC55A1_3113 [Vibrio cholerae HC-55A1]|nr:hypothetical protein VCHC55A1_3113 [Vibrio cholerae HC-55A1]
MPLHVRFVCKSVGWLNNNCQTSTSHTQRASASMLRSRNLVRWIMAIP